VRRQHALILLACLAVGLATAPEARTQDSGLQAYYWPHRTVGIPVNVAEIGKLNNKPSDLQLYYAVNGGAFQKGPKLPLNSMQSLDGGKKGFLFTAERDGDYEFAVQFNYSDGTSNPRTDELSAQQRIIVDTTGPTVKLYATNNGVEWVATDENLDPRGITLQCKWPASREWTTVTDRAFRTSDRFGWRLDPGKVLEVRVLAKDRAGHDSFSPIVRVPPDAANGASFPRPSTGGAPEWVGGGTGGGGGSSLPAARIDYVSTLKFDVDYAIEQMGPSGVKAAHLFVRKNQGDWVLAKQQTVNLRPSDKEQTISIPFEAREEGTYDFHVIPESGAGKRASDPRRGDAAMLHVVVDTTAPYVQITGVQVRPGGTRGALVEINWEVADPNLMPNPISLEWSLDPKSSKWNEIKYRLSNTSQTSGRFTWEVPDSELWKFYIRARAVDRASNTGEHVWGQDSQKSQPPKEVIVDLVSPTGGIKGVRGGNAPAGGGSPTPKPGGSDDPVRPPPATGSGTGPEVPMLPKFP
jgi:hypothetical protein